MPEAFFDRINELVTGIAQELSEGKVQLNEDDYATMKPYLTDLGYDVVVNSNLMRGDVTLQFDGVEVHDVAANRMASSSALETNNAADDTVDIADTTDATVADDIAADNDIDVANMITGDVSLQTSDEPDS